jgi:uncharacterized surface protein with fasciclin (FAS1) repeats
MIHSRTFKAAVLAAPLSFAAMYAHAADIVGAIQDQSQFSKLAKAVEAAGIAQALEGDGPYTVFAPTDQAFEQLPKGALDELMKDGNQSQLKALLQYHVVEGKELMAKDAIGSESKVATLEGGSLSIDGTGKEVLLVPTGLVVTRIGDEVFVEREVTAVTSPQVEVAPAGQGQQNQGQQASSGSQSRSSSGSQSQGSDQSQQQASSGQSQSGSSQSQQQTASSGSQSGQGQQQDKGMLREARVVEPDIQADNGVIHAIDVVLVPQSVLSNLESMPAEQQSQGQQQDKANQG